jgi:GT2 family glycosyltransferase
VISFITVAYNSSGTLRGCLEAALRQPNTEVIVVDNASSDDSAQICASYKKVRLIKSDTNLGFNGGNQLGVEQAKGDIIVFLNPDAVIPAGFAEKLERAFADMPEVGVIGCRMVHEDGSLQRTGNRFPTMASLLYEFSAFHDFFPRSQAFNRYTIAGWDRTTSRQVDAVAGSCMAVRRSDLDRIGGLALDYFLFFEEFDLSRRVKAIGKATYYAADIKVKHVGGVSTKQVQNKAIDKIYFTSRDRYISKFHGPIFLSTFKALAWVFNKAHGLGRRIRRTPQG